MNQNAEEQKLKLEVGEDKKLSRTRIFSGPMQYFIFAYLAAMTIFHLWTGFAGALPALQQRAVHLIFAFPMIFIIFPAVYGKRMNSRSILFIDVLLAALSFYLTFYLYINYYDLFALRLGNYTQPEVVMAVIGTILVMEACRRTMGWPLVILSLICLIYGLLGHKFPGLLAHRGYGVERLFTHLWYTSQGVFGLVMGVMATFVVMFVVFGAALEAMGGGNFIKDMSYALLGRLRGGPAKMAVVASGFFGSINGSVTANVVTTGSFTIPLMKNLGLKKEFSGAVEASASTGGQFMPPVMGAAGFIIAESLRVPYTEVILAAFIPAILYYFALYLAVDLESAKLGLKGLPREELPKAREALKKGWHFLIPVAVLIYTLVIKMYSPALSASLTIAVLFAVCLIREPKKETLWNILECLAKGAQSMLPLSAIGACMGIVIGVVLLSGLGTTFSAIIVNLAGEHLILLLVMAMVSCIILGMGIPTTAAYIIVSILVIPGLVDLGIAPLAGHLFCLYFAVISNITPPVAVGAFVGAQIAGGNPMRTGFTAVRIALPGFILPFMFIYNPPLIFDGSPLAIAQSSVTAMIGVYALACSLQGYSLANLVLLERIALLVASILLIFPGLTTDLSGLLIVISVMALQKMRIIKSRQPNAGGDLLLKSGR